MTSLTAPEMNGSPAGPEESSIGPTTLRRLAAAWPRRATIRTDMATLHDHERYDPALLDYPQHLLPFAEHPDFLAASEDQRRLVNTLGWLAYNERVIAAEEHVANPTFAMLAHGDLPGAESFEAKEAVQQAHIDETWHTYMHMLAVQRTREARDIPGEPAYVHPVTNRTLYRLCDESGDRQQRNLLFLLWTAVGEISVNAYLDLLARDRTIQPLHAHINHLHARDEAAHGPVLLELMKEIFPRLDQSSRDFVIRMLPDAILAFGAEDYELWPQVLRASGIGRVDDIIGDTRSLPGSELLVTDFSGVARLCRELGIEDRVEFDFTTLTAGRQE
ncbi:diiron oxygenase [Streptomyces sp. NPDC088387]|uniref:diiron oxygenase n=1 Tax=Streptomyces sp. NPDC088387 TaxID=3365859 RepID=UPI003806B07E